MNKTWQGYNSSLFYDELLTSSGNPRAAARGMINFLQRLPEEEINERRSAAELAIRDMGISFTVYTEGGNIDRNWPFDIIPRTITAKEWSKISLGLQQRTRALNCFIDDIYNKKTKGFLICYR